MVVRDVVELVGIGGVHVRDAVLVVCLAPLLDRVDPGDGARVGVRVGVCAGDARTKALAELGLGVLVERGARAHHAVVEHEREDLLGAHCVSEALGAVLVALAPVLVEVELAVAVEVLERVAVDLDDLCGVHDAERGAALLGHPRPAVAHLLGGPLGLDVLAVRVDGVAVGRRRRSPVARRRRGRVAAGEAHEACRDRGGGQEVPARDVAHFLLPFFVPLQGRASGWIKPPPAHEPRSPARSVEAATRIAGGVVWVATRALKENARRQPEPPAGKREETRDEEATRRA